MPQYDDIAVLVNPLSKDAENAAKFINEHLRERTDPASHAKGMPPLYGQDAVPHMLTFQSLVGSFSRAYLNPDEAIRDSVENAHLMEKDVGILESVECRQRLTALLDWEIKPEDEKCQYQMSLAQELQRIIGRIKHFTKYRMWLMKAIWNGRSGIQHKYGYTSVNGKMRLMPTPLHRDHNGWMPINGDKLVFRYEDGLISQGENAYPHQMGIRVGTLGSMHNLRVHRDYKLEPVSDGLALFLKPYERDTFVVHKHFIEDASFHHSYFSGSIHGIGIRSKIYWEWYLKQEAFAFLMQYLERSAGGIEVWTYPMGQPGALEKAKEAAREKMANGRNVVFFPKPMGDDADVYKFEVIEPGAMGLDIIQSIVENYFGGRLKRYILGQELSTEAKSTGLGSAVAEAHMDTLSQIIEFDAKNLEETLTYELVRYIQQLNFPETMGWHMRMSLKTKDEKVQERLEALNTAYSMGARVAENEVFKTLGLSAPTSGERVLSMQSQQPAMPGMPGAIPESGGFPDQESEGNQETADDPMAALSGILDQYSMNTMPPDDVQERATLIAEILTGLYGDDVEMMLADKYARAFDPDKHPRHQAGRSDGGRFRPLLDEHEHAGVVSEVKSIVQRGQKSPETIGRVAGHLSRMSVAQLNAFKKEHGIKASGVKEELVQKIAQRLIMGGLGGTASPDTRAASAKQKTLFDDDKTTEQESSSDAVYIQHQTEPKDDGSSLGSSSPKDQKADPPSVETVPQPTAPEPVAAAQPEPPSPNADMPTKPVAKRRMMGGSADSMKSVAAPSIARTTPKPEQPASAQSVAPISAQEPKPEPAPVEQPPEQPAKAVTPLTDQQKQLVNDNYGIVAKVLKMTRKQWSTRDQDEAESAAMQGLIRAAQTWDGSSDFETYAKNGAIQAIKNLNRRKMDKLKINQGEAGEEGDLLDTVQSRAESSQPQGGKLDDAISKLGSEADQFLVRSWFSRTIDNDPATQDEIAQEYQARFGGNATRQAVAVRAAKLLTKLQGLVKGDYDQYQAVKLFVERYYRSELIDQQRERYEKRLDRTIREAAEYTETDPSDSQIKAGNYRKGRFSWNGMKIVIENPRGSVRRGISDSGEIWRHQMTAHYGYISGTEGRDGDQVDCFMGRYPESELVFVVKQIDQSTGQFDEHKVILGTLSEKTAKQLYLSNYSKGWKCGEIDCMTLEDFRNWLNGGCC